MLHRSARESCSADDDCRDRLPAPFRLHFARDSIAVQQEETALPCPITGIGNLRQKSLSRGILVGRAALFMGIGAIRQPECRQRIQG